MNFYFSYSRNLGPYEGAHRNVLLEGGQKAKKKRTTSPSIFPFIQKKKNPYHKKIDAWVQIACPRLSIDWVVATVKNIDLFEITDIPQSEEMKMPPGSEYTQKPLLTPYEAFVALNATAAEESTETASIPMDFYARRGGEWEKAELQDDDEEEEEEDNENDGDYQDEGRDYDGNKDDDDDGDDRSVSATAAALACATITEIEKNKKSKHGERRRKECISEEEWREENEADPKSSKKQLLHDVSPAAHSSRSTSSSKEVLVRIGTRAFKKPGTLVIGLDSYGIELSDAKKKFAKKVAERGVDVTGRAP
eukprot:jgi/Bigna1/77895/fgenesh1_pg.51_\